MKQLLKAVVGAFLIFTGFLGLASATESAYPDRPIHLVVPFAPGGATDLLARLIAKNMTSELGQAIVVENKPGAGTMIGSNVVAKRPADGYTLLITSAGFLINPSIRDHMPYDTLKDFSLVTSVAVGPLVMVVNPSIPAKTLPEFVDYAKANPGKLSFGSSGIGGGSHLAGAQFKSMAKIDLLHIPYGGAGPVAVALVSGQVTMSIDAMAAYLPFIKSGQLRPLAVTSKKRFPLLPNVPTFAESGYPEYTQQGWWGILVRSGTPKEFTRKLNKAIVDALATKDVHTFLESQGLVVSTNTPEEAAHVIDAGVEEWAKVIKIVNVHIK